MKRAGGIVLAALSSAIGTSTINSIGRTGGSSGLLTKRE